MPALIRVAQGVDIEIELRNELPVETTIHWHGVRLPADQDGTSASQVAVAPGESYTYRFAARDAGTFWYHPHVEADVQIERGLYGALVVDAPDAPQVAVDRMLVLDDVKVDADGRLSEDTNALDLMLGRQGNVLLVNGSQRPRAPPGRSSCLGIDTQVEQLADFFERESEILRASDETDPPYRVRRVLAVPGMPSGVLRSGPRVRRSGGSPCRPPLPWRPHRWSWIRSPRASEEHEPWTILRSRGLDWPGHGDASLGHARGPSTNGAGDRVRRALSRTRNSPWRVPVAHDDDAADDGGADEDSADDDAVASRSTWSTATSTVPTRY